MLCKSLATEQKHNATAAGVASATTCAVGGSPKPPKPGPLLTRELACNGDETARSPAFSAERRQAGASFLQMWAEFDHGILRQFEFGGRKAFPQVPD
jgi:hypothetical protein